MRPMPSGKALLVGLTPGKVLGMSDTLPAACPFLGQYPWRPGMFGQGWPRAGAMLGYVSVLCGL